MTFTLCKSKTQDFRATKKAPNATQLKNVFKKTS